MYTVELELDLKRWWIYIVRKEEDHPSRSGPDWGKSTRKGQGKSKRARDLCWSQSKETWALPFTNPVMLGKLLSLSEPASSSPFYLSQLRGSNGHESILKSVKCCPNLGIIITIRKLRYWETRQASRDLMLQTRGLKVADVLFGPQWSCFSLRARIFFFF